MAKLIKFIFEGKAWQAGISKLDRDKVYGYVEEQVSDAKGNPCAVGSLLDDGQTVILSGSAATKLVDAHLKEVDRKTLRAVDAEGHDATMVPSSYDVDVPLSPATLDDLFNMEVTGVYQLAVEDPTIKQGLMATLEAGRLLRCSFNYRASYESADALMIAAQKEIFILTGRIAEYPYLENKVVVLQEEASSEAEDESVDFSML